MFNCEDGNLTIAGPARIQTIVKFSKEYKDDFYDSRREIEGQSKCDDRMPPKLSQHIPPRND